MPSKTSRPDGRKVAQPRLRILAGPNRSGKSTIKGEFKPQWIGVFVNADEIERGLRDTAGALDLASLGLAGRPADVLRRMEKHIKASTFAQQLGLRALVGRMTIDASLQLINVDRVRRRVKLGGHPVPAKKVRERYARSVGLMTEACGVAHRAYVFDNSGSRHKLLVQVVDGHEMEIEVATLPRGFVETELWRSFNG